MKLFRRKSQPTQPQVDEAQDASDEARKALADLVPVAEDAAGSIASGTEGAEATAAARGRDGTLDAESIPAASDGDAGFTSGQRDEAPPDAPADPVDARTQSPEVAVSRTDGAQSETAAPRSATAEATGSEATSSAARAPEATGDSAGDRGGFFARLRRGLGRTSDNLVSGLGNLFLGSKVIDDDLFEELETRLLLADVGVDATTRIIGQLTERVSRRELGDPQALLQALRDEMQATLAPCEQPLDTSTHRPYVILVVGVNGVGKTTTIGKLARRFQEQGQSVMLAAGDTFRAAAVEQLQVWGERHDVPVVAQHSGADSASVLFDALQAAQSRGVDVLIADTAGRLHNKSHLMDELRKVVRVLGKLDADAPHEVMLVLDAGTGQNALAQAAQFTEAVGVSGITLTKLDGTAKGGVIFAIAEQLRLPIRFVGVGEKAEDLRPFVAADFIEALFRRE